MKPGEIITCEGEDFISANENLETVTIGVSNTGDRPIQVGSHIHFFEVNQLTGHIVSQLGYMTGM